MSSAVLIPMAQLMQEMADGTIKQVNPFSGTEVWTVPGRGHRPLGISYPDPQPLRTEDEGRWCAFCENRYLETPPEKSRVIREGERWLRLDGLGADHIHDSIAEFRRIPNLFEIVSYDYWHQNYGYAMPPDAQRRMDDYLATTIGRDHVLRILQAKLRAAGHTNSEWAALTEEERRSQAAGFFGGGHDVIVARRHFVEGAYDDSMLASSGTLSPEEHYQYMAFSVDAMKQLYKANRYVRYVAAFQNWLKPAGASFDHLHKQLVAIDERGVNNELEIERIRANPNLYNEAAVNYAGYHNLVIAENEHAVAFAGFGHRYPTLEVYSKSAAAVPWKATDEEVRAMSDLLHACHAATGADVPTNEEWYHRPIDVLEPMPWRIMLKWRVSNLAGFEGGTKIYLNTLSPVTVRDRVVPKLYELRDRGRIANMRIATEALCEPNSLRYIEQTRH
ncbi:DUF4921 family protein [Raineyella fluvialis]|uniref:DUF4921 family protein n=1 Tax=Raineyella fluvialis TaxID=2662261 RepID=A0A5Q2FD49_9ACTN|nr:DUF4921 family protein [Raineyella fluvialis]QGF24718.1 DUF4921 family protein [Raineyella fluvialis]